MRPVIALAAALAVAGAIAAPSAQAAADPLALSRQIAAPWPGMQRADGGFPDYLEKPGRSFRSLYGDAMLGYGLIQNGLRDGDQAQLGAGINGVTRAVRDPGPADARKNAFEDLAVAAAYNLARGRLAADSRFAGVRGEWEAYLQASRFQDLTSGRDYYNYFLVESVMALELLRSGLSSTVSGSVLADPAGSRARVERLVNSELPMLAKRYSRANPGSPTLAILPDPPRNPLAYHALQVALLAHAVELLGPQAKPAARILLARAASASAALAGPDGDVSYFGRSQELAWTLPLTAFGAEVAAAAEPDAAKRAPLTALSDRVLDRLAAVYGAGLSPYGIALSPAMRTGKQSALRSLDSYVGGVDYAGLTLVGVNWAAERRAARAARAGLARTLGDGQAAAQSDGSFLLQKTPVTFASVQRGDAWYAVKERPTGGSDIRYDFGLMAFKLRSGRGFRDISPPRPKTPSKGSADSAGPILLGSDGRKGFPNGSGLAVAQDGSTAMKVSFRDRSGRTLRSGVPVRYALSGRCVRLRFPVRAGETYEYSVFVRGKAKPTARGVSDPGQRVTFSVNTRSKVKSGFASGLDASLERVRFSFSRPTAGDVTIATCAR